MPWPAYMDGTEYAEGTMYVNSAVIGAMIAKHERSGQAWKFRDRYTTYRPNNKVSYKTLDRLNVGSQDAFDTLMGACKMANLNAPPSSWSDIFRSVYPTFRPRLSTIAPFYGRTYGGWQEALQPGKHSGRIYHYDLNKAYRWSASLGLPNMRTAFPLDRCDRWPEHGAVFLVEGRPGQLPYWKRAGAHTVTAEELPFVRGRVRILGGIGFRDLVDLRPAFQTIDESYGPWASQICRTFWGQWNSVRGPKRETWRSGHKVTEQDNPFHNPVWAALIAGRVRARMLAVSRYALHVFVDSILSTVELPTGTDVGEWKCLASYHSVWVKAAGQWGSGWESVRYVGKARSEADGAVRPWLERLEKVRP